MMREDWSWVLRTPLFNFEPMKDAILLTTFIAVAISYMAIIMFLIASMSYIDIYAIADHSMMPYELIKFLLTIAEVLCGCLGATIMVQDFVGILLSSK